MPSTMLRQVTMLVVLWLSVIGTPWSLLGDEASNEVEIDRLYQQVIELSSQGRLQEAIKSAESLVALDSKTYEADRRDTAIFVSILAGLYKSMGRYTEAERLYQRALKICDAKLGTDDPDTAKSLDDLAALYESLGRSAEAAPIYQCALKIYETKLGPEFDTAEILNKPAVLHGTQGRWAEAAGVIDRARHSLLRHIRSMLPALAENQQLAFLKFADEDPLHFAFSLTLLRAADPATSALSGGWVVNRKGLTRRTVVERGLPARGDKNPATAKSVAQLRAVRTRLAAVPLAKPQPGQEDQRTQRIAQFNDQERELSQTLGQATGRAVRDDPWVKLDSIRKTIADDTVLVEITRFGVFDFRNKVGQKQWQAPRYAAWVIPAAGRGDVRVIDEAVAAARTALKVDLAVLQERGESEVEQNTRVPLEVVAKLVLNPLLPHIEKAEKWVISPDEVLWLIPWVALPLDAENSIVEKHEVRYVISGRDLAVTEGEPDAGQALVMADPDFSLDPGAALAATRAVLRGAACPAATELALRGTSSELSLGTVARLPGTAAEAIAPMLKSFTGSKPIVYADRYALEAVFKAFQHPRVVVMSTHGFFLADQETAPGDMIQPPMVGETPLVKSENPLLRCGLLLAGCNQKGGASGEDGVLTGLEIVGTDLQGTELGVLSAC